MPQLTSVAGEVRKYTGDIADYVDVNFDYVADMLREQLASAPWLPELIRARLPQPRAPSASQLVVTSNMTFYERVQDWVLRHRILTTLAILFTGTMSYRAVRRSISARKFRRARRAKNGARCEVVVIAASPALPVTQSLALDLERRGFVVYIVCGSAEDEQAVRHMSRSDIKPLSVDITDVRLLSVRPLFSFAPTANGPRPRAQASPSSALRTTSRHPMLPCPAPAAATSH